MRSQQRQGDDDIDMEAALGPQHGKFEAKAPEIEELKLRVEALQAQVPFNATLSSLFATAKSDFSDRTFGAAVSERHGPAVPSGRILARKQGDAKSKFHAKLQSHFPCNCRPLKWPKFQQ
jgi:hypothetical protein